MFSTPWTAAHQASMSFTISRNLLKLMSIDSEMPSDHLVLCRSLPLRPSVLPSIRVFSMTQSFASGGQSIRASVSASDLPMNIQGSLPLGWTGWISLQFKGLSRVFSSTTVQIINSLTLSLVCSPTLTLVHDYWKNHNFGHTDSFGSNDLLTLSQSVCSACSLLPSCGHPDPSPFLVLCSLSAAALA